MTDELRRSVFRDYALRRTTQVKEIKTVRDNVRDNRVAGVEFVRYKAARFRDLGSSLYCPSVTVPEWVFRVALEGCAVLHLR